MAHLTKAIVDTAGAPTHGQRFIRDDAIKGFALRVIASGAKSFVWEGRVNIHGFIFADGRFIQFDAAGSSQTAAFGVMGTLINGVNDHGDIVGFFSDGTKVNGFVNFAPASD